MQTQAAKKEVLEEPGENVAFQFRVFRDQQYVRLNGFKQPRITIGRSPRADLVLEHPSVGEFHADVSLTGGLFFLTNHKPNNGLRVNGQSAKKTQLRDSDIIDIGPFSIVFKPIIPAAPKAMAPGGQISEDTQGQIVGSPAKDGSPDWFDGTYAVVLENEYESESARETVAEHLALLFKKSPEKIRPLLNRPGQVVKKDISLESAQRLQKLLEMAGAGAELKPMEGPGRQEPDAEATSDAEPVAKVEVKTEIAPETAAEVNPEVGPEITGALPAFDPDEDDEEDPVGNFNLKDRLGHPAAKAAGPIRSSGPCQLEVIKAIGSRVVDVQHIGRGSRYRADGEGRGFHLAELTGKSRGYVTFPENWQGHLVSNGKQETLDTYKTEKNLHRRRGSLYRLPVSMGDSVVATDGHCEYQVRYGVCSQSPTVVQPPAAKEITLRHWGVSVGFHLVFLLIACIVFALSTRGPEEETLHFVKVDMSQFEEQPLPAPEPEPAPPAPVQKTEPVTPAKVEPAKKAPEVQKKAVKKTTQTAKETPQATPQVAGGSTEAATNSHPDAGGGFGEGNTTNRNINQTGLLSLLGDGAASSPGAAPVDGGMIAEVTNLDAVEVPGGGTANQFSVGGIKGSLGTGKISLASGQAVAQTKGGQQVLRSVGAEGPGTVAALEKGEIGNKQVRGLVTAKMSKSVSIQGGTGGSGGMSREAVKRVIDQHLDEIQYCYESALLENSAIMGRIVYEWKILMSGQVGEIRIVSSTVNSHLIHDCIKEAIKTWQFPKPVGSEVVVSYPFVFDLVGF